MSRSLFALTALSVLAVAPVPAGGQASSLPTDRMLAPHGLERMWWNQATMDPSRDRVLYLTADENVVIVQSRSGLVTTFDLSSGRKLWAVQVSRVDAVSFPAITNDELVLIVSGLSMYALEKFNGKLVWNFSLPSSPSTSPGIDDERVYVGARDGSVYAFNLRKIRTLFNERRLPQWSNQTLDWRYKAFKEVTTPPISTGRVVNFASRGGSLYSVTTTDRKLSFQFETDFPVSAPMAESQRSLFLPSEDFKLYCLNNENGVTRWVYNAGLEIRKAPIVIGTNVYITPSHGGLHSITTTNRKTTGIALIDNLAIGDEVSVSINGVVSAYVVQKSDKSLSDVAAGLVKDLRAKAVADVTVETAGDEASFVLHSPPSADISSRVRRGGAVIEDKIRQTSRTTLAGGRLWWQPKITGLVATSFNRLYATDNVGNLLVLSREEGKTLAALPLRDFSIRVANGRTDRIIIAKPSGLVACIRETGHGFPTYHMFPERRPLLPEFAPAPAKK